MPSPCGKCGSEKAFPASHVCSHMNSEITAILYRNPNAFLMKDPIRSRLNAVICGECGYVEFFAKDHALLYKVYRQREEKKPL